MSTYVQYVQFHWLSKKSHSNNCKLKHNLNVSKRSLSKLGHGSRIISQTLAMGAGLTVRAGCVRSLSKLGHGSRSLNSWSLHPTILKTWQRVRDFANDLPGIAHEGHVLEPDVSELQEVVCRIRSTILVMRMEARAKHRDIAVARLITLAGRVTPFLVREVVGPHQSECGPRVAELNVDGRPTALGKVDVTLSTQIPRELLNCPGGVILLAFDDAHCVGRLDPERFRWHRLRPVPAAHVAVAEKRACQSTIDLELQFAAFARPSHVDLLMASGAEALVQPIPDFGPEFRWKPCFVCCAGIHLEA